MRQLVLSRWLSFVGMLRDSLHQGPNRSHVAGFAQYCKRMANYLTCFQYIHLSKKNARETLRYTKKT